MSCQGLAAYQSDMTIVTPATWCGKSEYIFADLFLNKPYTKDTLPLRYHPFLNLDGISDQATYRQVNAMIFRRNFGKTTRYYPWCNAIAPTSMLMTASMIVQPVVFMIDDGERRLFLFATFHEDYGTAAHAGEKLPRDVDSFCQCKHVICAMSNGYLAIEVFEASQEGDTDLVARMFGDGRHPSACRELAQDFARYALCASGEFEPPTFPEVRDYALRQTLVSVLSNTSPSTATVTIEPESRFGIPEGEYKVEVAITKQ